MRGFLRGDGFVLIAGLDKILLGECRVLDVIGFLSGVGISGLRGVGKTDVEAIVAVGRRIHDLVRVQRSLDCLAGHQVVTRPLLGIRVGGLDPPVLQGDEADVLVVLQFGGRLGRNVLNAL
jgi:hypothetical protein